MNHSTMIALSQLPPDIGPQTPNALMSFSHLDWRVEIVENPPRVAKKKKKNKNCILCFVLN